MEINSRNLSQDDFYELISSLKPQPVNYFNIFLTITAAILFSSAIQAGAVFLYAQHQIDLVNQQAQVVTQQLQQSQARADDQVKKLQQQQLLQQDLRESCFDIRREYAGNPSAANHAAMAQACTNAGMPY